MCGDFIRLRHSPELLFLFFLFFALPLGLLLGVELSVGEGRKPGGDDALVLGVLEGEACHERVGGGGRGVWFGGIGHRVEGRVALSFSGWKGVGDGDKRRMEWSREDDRNLRLDDEILWLLESKTWRLSLIAEFIFILFTARLAPTALNRK